MAEYSNEDHDAVVESLAESEDVRRIKEEWTRLQMAANGRQSQESSGGEQGEGEGNADRRTQILQDSMKKPPSRLPSLDSMVDRIPSIPSMEISTGLGKKLPDLGSVGHRLGIMADPRDLEPHAVTLEKTSFNFGADTPTQTDIKWTPPANHSQFKSMTYDIEVDGGQGWMALMDNRLPILRVYFTSSKIIMGRFSKLQEAEPVALRLRIRATGVIKTRTQEESISGPWSQEIWLYLEGSTVASNSTM